MKQALRPVNIGQQYRMKQAYHPVNINQQYRMKQAHRPIPRHWFDVHILSVMLCLFCTK